jgi:hypothetical protein
VGIDPLGCGGGKSGDGVARKVGKKVGGGVIEAGKEGGGPIVGVHWMNSSGGSEEYISGEKVRNCCLKAFGKERELGLVVKELVLDVQA